MEDLTNWEDENKRIASAELDYKKILNRELERVAAEIEKLEAMDRSY